MRIVETATKAPGMCLASRDTDGPFFDTGLFARHRDPYMYISCKWVEEAAQELGMVPASEVEALKEQLESYAAKIENLERFVEAHRSLEAAAEEVAPVKERLATYNGFPVAA
jgi:hypothetical protein